MKKMLTLAMMLVMLFAFSITANAAKDPVYSPSGKPVTEEGTDVVTSPKTGESEILLYGYGTAAVVFASGAVVLRKKVM